MKFIHKRLAPLASAAMTLFALAFGTAQALAAPLPCHEFIGGGTCVNGQNAECAARCAERDPDSGGAHVCDQVSNGACCRCNE